MAYLFVAILRFVLPLYIFKNPFLGAVLAVLADAVDMEITKWLGPVLQKGFVMDFNDYRLFDVGFDSYFLLLAFYKSLDWNALVKKAFLALFSLRALGLILFLILGNRVFLFYFPNLFEFFFLFYAFVWLYCPSFQINTVKKLALILFLLLIPKMAEEYVLHIDQAQMWRYFKHEVLLWPKSPAD